MTHDILITLWRATLTASVAICVVLALRLFARRWLGAQAAYTLWLLVPVAMLAMLLPAPAKPLLEALRVAPSTVAAAPAIMLDAAVEPTRLDPRPWLLATWLVGALAMLAALTWQQRRYLRALGPLSADGEGALRAQGPSGSPALVGALFPRIVLPVDFEERFDARERELVLAHERAHLGHGDAQVNAFVALLRCLQWFNPLLHFAASRLRIDQELACDARVIARFPEARRPYADAMLKAQLIGEARQELRLPIGCYWPSSHPLKERISMLKLPVPTRTRRALASAVAMVLALGAGYASWAAQPGATANDVTMSKVGNNRAVFANFIVSIDGRKVIDSSSPPQGKRAPGDWEVETEGNAIVFRESKKFEVLTSAADPFSVAMRKEGESWLLNGTANPLAPGTIEFFGTLEHNGEVVSQPRLLAREGELVAFQVGESDAASGGFKGIRIYLAFELAKSLRPSQGDAPLTPAQNVVDAEPAENLEFRKMRPPRYPPEAVKDHIQGKVMLKVQMDAEGVPLGTEVVSVEPKEASVLADAAIATAMQWRYKPGMKDGKPVGGYVLVPVDFSLHDDDRKPTSDVATPQSVIAASYRRMRPPHYPAAALAEHATGIVWVRAQLNSQGSVTEVHAEQTWPQSASELAEAAVDAVKSWTFNPPTVNGAPVEGEVVVPLQFLIAGDTAPATTEPVPAFPSQTPLLATIMITGDSKCTRDCPPPPPAPPAPEPPPPTPPKPVNAASIAPAIFEIFPTDEQRC